MLSPKFRRRTPTRFVWVFVVVLVLTASSHWRCDCAIPSSAIESSRYAENRIIAQMRNCPPPKSIPDPPGFASALSPAQLLCRPLNPTTAVPKLLHQTWKSSELPAKFKLWSDGCREKHPDWEWVLWTDEDNLRLVQEHFPELEDTYMSLPGNIYRVDFMRNLYMYRFGGVYADLDTECLRSNSDILSRYTDLQHHTDISISEGTVQTKFAFFGRMGTDTAFEHHIPNAWMAASPRHPFFLLPLESASAEIARSRRPLHQLWYDFPSAEQMTGPVALRRSLIKYLSRYTRGADIALLPESAVYPFDWNAGEETRALCSAEQETFDEAACKEALGVERRGSISITYWSHTHRGTGEDVRNIKLMSEK